MKKVPAYITKDVERLSKHLDKVDELSREIQTWVEKTQMPTGAIFLWTIRWIIHSSFAPATPFGSLISLSENNMGGLIWSLLFCTENSIVKDETWRLTENFYSLKME